MSGRELVAGVLLVWCTHTPRTYWGGWRMVQRTHGRVYLSDRLLDAGLRRLLPAPRAAARRTVLAALGEGTE